MCKLSIIVPVYGVEAYLEKCLDSIYPQLTDECEVILVDDGSPDKCPEICDAYKEKYPHCTRVIHQENMGLGGARNSGIKVANGEFLFFIDSDDTITPNAISVIFAALEKYNCDITVFPLHIIAEDGSLIADLQDQFECHKVFDPKENTNVITGTPVAWNKITRASLFEKTGVEFPSRVWYEDIRTTPKLIAMANSIVYTDEPLYNYLRREGSIMNSAKLDRNSEIMDAMDDLLEYFTEKGLVEKYSAELEYLIIDHVLVSATVRLLKSGANKHPLIKEFYDYTKKKCAPLKKKSNPYIKTEMPQKRRLIYKLLKAKMYFAVRLIFKVKG